VELRSEPSNDSECGGAECSATFLAYSIRLSEFSAYGVCAPPSPSTFHNCPVKVCPDSRVYRQCQLRATPIVGCGMKLLVLDRDYLDSASQPTPLVQNPPLQLSSVLRYRNLDLPLLSSSGQAVKRSSNRQILLSASHWGPLNGFFAVASHRIGFLAAWPWPIAGSGRHLRTSVCEYELTHAYIS
jgi:hypothetical protein